MSALCVYRGGAVSNGVPCDKGVEMRCESSVMSVFTRVVGVLDLASLIMTLHCIACHVSTVRVPQ